MSIQGKYYFIIGEDPRCFPLFSRRRVQDPTPRTVFSFFLSILTDEVVILPGLEFEASGLRCKRAERDREEHKLVGFVTDGDDPWVGVRDPAHVVLVLGHLRTNVLPVSNAKI